MSATTDGFILPAGDVALEGVTAESPRSAVSWPAVLAGAAVAGGTSLIMLALGSGFGLATTSPFPGAGPSLATFTVVAGIWLIVTQWAASGVGGYLTGRLRTRWANTHTHEVFFRDTAHGFLAWAVATLVVALLATTAASVAASTAARNADTPYDYAVDSMFRSSRLDYGPAAPAMREEAARIFARGVVKAPMPVADRDYLAYLVSVRTGLSAVDARARVDATVSTAERAADDARKGAAAASIFTALAMLIGAFIASVAAVLGGQQRDEHL